MTKMAAMPINGKTLKNSSSPELKSSTGSSSTTKFVQMTLTYFTAMSNLVSYESEKGKAIDFSEAIVVYVIKVIKVGGCS